MYSLHDITRTCVKLENPDTTSSVENLQDSAPVPSPTVKMEQRDTVCDLKIHQVMSGNQVVIENGIPVRGVTSPIPLSTHQHMPTSQIPLHNRPSPRQMDDHSEKISSDKATTKFSCGIVATVDGHVYQIGSGCEPETQIAPMEAQRGISPMANGQKEAREMSALYQSVSVDQRRENVSVTTQPSNAQTTTYQTEGPNWNHHYQAVMPSPEISSIHGGRLGYRLLSRDAKSSSPIGPGEGLLIQQGAVFSNNETRNEEENADKQVNAREGASAYSSGNQEISPHQILGSNQVDTKVEMLSYRISTQNGMIPHQMGPSYETANHKTGVPQGMSVHQMGTQTGSLPLEINTMNRMVLQSKPRDGMIGHQMMAHEEVQNSKQVETQQNLSSDQMALWSHDRSPYPRPNEMSVYSAGAHRAVPGYHVGTYAHKISSEDGTSCKAYDVHSNLLPPYEVESYRGMPSYRRLSHDSMLPYPAANYDKVPSYPTGFQENGTRERMELFQIDSRAMQQNNGHTCHCSCHLSSPPQSSHFPAFGLESQRPSVIMVPFMKNGTVPGTPQLHSKREDQDLPLKQPQLNHEMNYSDDSDSSDGCDGEGQRDKYFRRSLDGTTAKFKLSKEDWKRIPINTFPSGGRLLSGDWTRIFLSKVKESNPWCSLRFKNNHVRSENSRKIHSAVFFRGGAECKRPECNVKVRFVIRKEKGKYVDVTYVGDVCHSSQPGGSDVTKEKKRAKRARRPSSVWSE